MADPFVAEIRIFGFNFAPRGWAFCDGQLLAIGQNTALFSLLGTNYGGDGKSTFALPNLQGAAPMFYGQGPGLTEHFLGEVGGSTTVTLLESEMPAHSHQFPAQNGRPSTSDPNGSSLTTVSSGQTPYISGSSNTSMSPASLTVAGSSLPHNNMQPYLTMNFCIALQGVFPPRG